MIIDITGMTVTKDSVLMKAMIFDHMIRNQIHNNLAANV